MNSGYTSSFQAQCKGLCKWSVALWQGRAPPCPALERVQLGRCQCGFTRQKRGWRSCQGVVLHRISFKSLPAAASSKGERLKAAGSSRQPLPWQPARLAGAYSYSALWWQLDRSPALPACKETGDVLNFEPLFSV